MSLVYLFEPSQAERVPSVSVKEEKPVYICVSGLTGAGKSTVLRLVAEHIAEHRSHVTVVDEKALHHPYLDRLFADPDRFAFELQLDFMVNRVLFVKRWLAAGHSLVIERSHLEDPVFIRHLAAFGHVTDQEKAAYLALWSKLAERLPLPDLVVFLDVPANVSIERLRSGDSVGERPQFVDDYAQRAWITSWHKLYRERFEELRSDAAVAERITTFIGDVDPGELRSVVAAALARSR